MSSYNLRELKSIFKNVMYKDNCKHIILYNIHNINMLEDVQKLFEIKLFVDFIGPDNRCKC